MVSSKIFFFISHTVLIFLVLMGCSNRGKRDTSTAAMINEQMYINCLLELRGVEILSKSIATNKEYYHFNRIAILKYYGITEQEFNLAHSYYSSDPIGQEKRMRYIIHKLDSLTKAYYQNRAKNN